jgi:hypothetical protein
MYFTHVTCEMPSPSLPKGIKVESLIIPLDLAANTQEIEAGNLVSCTMGVLSATSECRRMYRSKILGSSTDNV